MATETADRPDGVVDWSQVDGDLIAAPSHPTVVAVWRYWQAKHVAGQPPRRDALDPTELGRLLSHISLIDIEWEPMDFRARLQGNTIAAWMGFRLEGQYLADWGSDPAQEQKLRGIYTHLAQTAEPNFVHGYVPDGIRRVPYDAANLPIVDDRGRPVMILGCMGFWNAAGMPSGPTQAYLDG